MACPLIYPQLTRSIPDIVAKASRFFQLPLRMTACPLRRLDRIVVRWNRAAVPSDHVNPIYFKRVEQIRVVGSPRAIPSDPDLLSDEVPAARRGSRATGPVRSEARRGGKAWAIP